jgi:hypothetical protein
MAPGQCPKVRVVSVVAAYYPIFSALQHMYYPTLFFLLSDCSFSRTIDG